MNYNTELTYIYLKALIYFSQSTKISILLKVPLFMFFAGTLYHLGISDHNRYCSTLHILKKPTI